MKSVVDGDLAIGTQVYEPCYVVCIVNPRYILHFTFQYTTHIHYVIFERHIQLSHFWFRNVRINGECETR